MNIQSLESLDLGQNDLIKIPNSIGVTNLKRLILDETKITSLPESICYLESLTELNLNGTKITTLPESIGNLNQLYLLDLRNTNIQTLPSSVQKLNHTKIIINDKSLHKLFINMQLNVIFKSD